MAKGLIEALYRLAKTEQWSIANILTTAFDFTLTLAIPFDT